MHVDRLCGPRQLFSLDGFYVDSKWKKMQQDGNRLVMHVRLFSLLGLGAWVLGACAFFPLGTVLNHHSPATV